MELDSFVDIEHGTIDRRIFNDPEIFEMEMENIFGRAWLFLCHETQIPKPGDFFEAVMGRDNVLVVRQKDLTIRAFINSCMHRGNAVCRGEEGNAKNFMCTYHGWTYGLDGSLIGVPGLKEFYNDDLDLTQNGLVPVAQLDTYRGFVFGTFDSEAPDLQTYLGPTGRLGLDQIASRGDMQVIPGIQKFVIDCNWKFAVDNLFDWYHPQVSHMAAMAPGVLPRPQDEKQYVSSGGAETPDGEELRYEASGTAHESIVVIGEYGHAIGGPSTRAPRVGRVDPNWRDRDGVAEQLGDVGMLVAGHPNIFPNSWITVGGQLMLRIPRDANTTEFWHWSFMPKDGDEETKAGYLFNANHIFGPAGLLEQEDGENWAQSSKQTYGIRSRKIPQLLIMNLGRGKVIREDGLARIEGKTNEHAQLWTYNAWWRYANGCSWDEIRAGTEPPDFL